MKECHLVSGPAASGKTRYARRLASAIGGCLIDSDEVAERLIRAGLSLAGMDPDDRDSPAYKQAYRQAVYDTMFGIARSNLSMVPVVLAGPFTKEGGDAGWLDDLEACLGVKPIAHFIWCDPDSRKRRIIERGESRDRPKLEAWDDYLKLCREERPLWLHHFVDTSES